MTNEKAIELLNRISDSQFDGPHGDERREALEMAVRALFSQQTVNDSQGLVNDCIDRKMAIDAFEPEHDTDWYTPRIIEVLEALPPVQPTQTNADSTQTNALDCVSRQAVIDAVYSETVSTNPEHFKSSEKFIKFMDDDDIASFGKWQWANGFNTAVVAARIQLEKLPSAQPERKRGRWILVHEADENGNALYECSVCHKGETHVPTVDVSYCWNCGARMDGGESE